MTTSKLRVAYAAVLFVPAIVLVALTAAPAGATIPLTPYLDCVAYDAQSQIYTAYFGYTNAATVQFNFAIGSDNSLSRARRTRVSRPRSTPATIPACSP